MVQDHGAGNVLHGAALLPQSQAEFSVLAVSEVFRGEAAQLFPEVPADHETAA